LTDTVDIYLNGGSALAHSTGYVGGLTNKYSLDHTNGQVSFGSCQTLLAITGTILVGGYLAFTYTTTGDAPQINQQIIVAGSTHSNGVYIVTSVNGEYGSGYFVTSTAAGSAYASDPASGYEAWSLLTISAVSFSGSNATYSYTLAAGTALVSGMRVYVNGFAANAGNNGTFYIASLGAGTFTVSNTNVSTGNETHAATGVTDWLPVSGTVLTATFQFDFAVRFDVDKLAIQLEESDVVGGEPIASWHAITVTELRILPGNSQG